MPKKDKPKTYVRKVPFEEQTDPVTEVQNIQDYVEQMDKILGEKGAANKLLVDGKFNLARQLLFLLELKRNGGCITYAAEAVGIARRTVYAYMDKYPSFRDLVDDVREGVYEQYEMEAHRRAVKGVTNPVVQGGRVVTDSNGNPIMRTEYSDYLLKFLMEGRVKGFQRKVEVSGADGGPISMSFAEMAKASREDLKRD